MHWRLGVAVLVFFPLVGMLVGAILLGPVLFSGGGSSAAGITTVQSTSATATAIVRENAQPGSSGWRIPANRQASTQIQAYASATSISPNHSLTFYVSTQQDGIQYWLDIYRLGWYGGSGGRLMLSIGAQVGHVQGYYDATTHKLVNCTSCLTDPKTGLVEANWQPSYTLNIPDSWTTGIYLAKFTDASGMQTYVPFDVLGNFSSDYVAVTPDTTYEAYNGWGGHSLYDTDNGLVVERDNLIPRVVKVSFDRPYTEEAGSSQVLVFEADAIFWMERQGYDLSYISNLDLDKNPAQLLRHKGYISLGRDPGYPKDIIHVTALWRDPVLGHPENALIGIMYSDLTHNRRGFSWQVSTKTASFLFQGTSLEARKKYGCGLVGYEWDRLFTNGATPKGLQVLASSSVMNDNNVSDQSNTTYYIAHSGAMVFATGSIYWTSALDSYRLHIDKSCVGQPAVIPGIQRLMTNVMNALIIRHTPQS